MVLFGTIGAVIRFIDVSSSEIAFLRGAIGSISILVIIVLSKTRIHFTEIKKNSTTLIVSSLFLAGNWIFLFEAYRHATIAVAALLYYSAPAMVVVMSILILHEKLNLQKASAVIATIMGMILLSNIRNTDTNHYTGIIFGILAAFCYAGLMISNKLIKDLGSIETTVFQLSISSIFLFLYVWLIEPNVVFHIGATSLILIVLLGIVHTGIGFFLFFYSIKQIRAQEIAILGYFDPVVSILLSIALFKEKLSVIQIFGVVIILVSMFIGSIRIKRNKMGIT
jgi:drug/metabolite transporter (DMT)-like permease